MHGFVHRRRVDMENATVWAVGTLIAFAVIGGCCLAFYVR